MNGDASILGRSKFEWQTLGGWHTAFEIAQQPDVWRDLASAYIIGADKLKRWVQPYINVSEAQIIFTGAGTSAYVGETVAAHLRSRVPCHVQAIATTDLVANPSLLAQAKPTLLVSFARSGNSPESVEAVNLARSLLPRVQFLNIYCNGKGALAIENADSPDTLAFAMPPAACDEAFAMTSSYTSMMLAALAIFDEAQPIRASEWLYRLASVAEQLVGETWNNYMKAISGLHFNRVMFIGSGPLAAAAREAALKVLELNAGRIAAFSETSLGLRHGPKALIDDDTLVCCLLSTDEHTRRYDLDIVRELRAGPRRCQVLEIDPAGRAIDGNADRVSLPLGEEPPAWTAPVMMVLLQQLALELSIKSGLTPDNPFPDGSVNRVVQGVTIHPYIKALDLFRKVLP